MLEFGLLSISSFVNVLLGLTVFLKNSKSATNRLFLMLTVSFAIWSTVNYLSVHPIVLPQIVWVRLVLFCASFLCLSMYLTFTVFPSTKFIGKRRTRHLLTVYTLLVMALTLTPLVFKVGANGHPTPNFGIPFFTLLVILTLGGGIRNLIKKYHRASGKDKDQLRVVLIGISSCFGLIFLTNFILVVTLNYTGLIPYGSAFTLIFSGSLAYAIIRHRLFDIRLIVARSLGYALSIGFLATLYGVATVLITDFLSYFAHTALLTQTINIVLLTIAVLTYGSVKKFFERITNQIFYRDAYDPQAFLDNLNSVLVTSLELNVLLRQTSTLIEANLKSSFCSFLLMSTDQADTRVITDKSFSFNKHDIELVQATLSDNGQKVYLAEDLINTKDGLRSILNRKNIAVFVKLSDELGSTDNKPIGYVALGPKRSGSPYNKQDVRILGIIANELVIAIQNALRFEEIQDFAATLQEKVNQATYRLQKANEKLKSQDEAKDEFISMASHQLRTPLTSVKGYLSMTLEGDAGDLNEMQHKLLDQAFISSQRMVYLIADLLNVSRLKTGKFIIEAIPSNLAEVVEGEVSQLIDTAKGRNLSLIYNKPAHFPTLMLDETKIRQVVMNFTDNAIYYTPAGGHITLNLADKQGSIEFTVSDDGIGVPKAEQHHLFTKFYRAGNAKKARPDGTGLGLFMAQKVVIAQGGSVIFHSQEGKGSTFGFSFPKSRLQPSKSTASRS